MASETHGERASTPTSPNPFVSPFDQASSAANSVSDFTSKRSSLENRRNGSNKAQFVSYRLTGEYERPWLSDKRMKATRWNGVIVYVFIFLGLAGSGAYNYFQLLKVPKHDYCVVLDDDFASGEIDSSTWTHEVQIGGFGSGTFDWTTTDPANSYISDSMLYITPTLTTDSGITEQQLVNGYTLNLTTDGTCTSGARTDCSIRSNSTSGDVIPPVRSARLTTKGKKNIKYGKVEVIAKMPAGDWLWPAIWMMPENSVYGDWPRSGEIDIAEARGNPWQYPYSGRDTVASSLHWGPDSAHDGYYLTYGSKYRSRDDFSQKFHTFGVEWSEDYIFMYLDSRIKQVYYLNFPKAAGTSTTGGLWDFGKFTQWIRGTNNTIVDNPWAGQGPNAPFDQEFYLILNVAVGGTNGFFPDTNSKPWVNSNTDASLQFWEARQDWLSSWGGSDTEDRSMRVKSVKMWQQGKCA